MFFNLAKNKEVTERKKSGVPIESNESLPSLMESKSELHGNTELYYLFSIMKVSVCTANSTTWTVRFLHLQCNIQVTMSLNIIF